MRHAQNGLRTRTPSPERHHPTRLALTSALRSCSPGPSILARALSAPPRTPIPEAQTAIEPAAPSGLVALRVPSLEAFGRRPRACGKVRDGRHPKRFKLAITRAFTGPFKGRSQLVHFCSEALPVAGSQSFHRSTVVAESFSSLIDLRSHRQSFGRRPRV